MQEKPLEGFSVQLATPCHNGSYVREYVKSFHNTACVLIEMGAKIDWAEFPGCADLALARAKIFGNFLRSSHSNLVLLDSDMGWEPMDVVRLLLAKKDFVGAAGPKKTPKLEFAANNCGDEGELLPIETEALTGLIKVTEIGMAFMCISKNCAQKIADAYPELDFNGDEGVTEHAVFDPFAVGQHPKRRRLSEDFAFCHRWRKIGGEIWVFPDMHLTHTGTAVWEGALIQSLQGSILDDQKAA